MKAIILKVIANQIIVWYKEQKITVFAPGKWKQSNIILHPGDYVELAYKNSELIITNLLDRKNIIYKPKLANIDNLVIIQSIVNPNISWLQLLKKLAFYEYHLSIVPIILFTKLDLQEFSQTDKIFIKDLINLNYPIFFKRNLNVIKELKKIFVSKISCFVGESGVGKSTLINELDPTFTRKHNEVSKKLKRGKNTTTTTELLPFCEGFLADTPGYSKFKINLTSQQLSESFHDFANFKLKCKFNDCLHLNENNCAIIKFVNLKKIPKWFYEIYKELQKQLKQI